MDRMGDNMKKCKECELFKNGCGFSEVDKELNFDGDFDACSHFIQSKTIRDCLSCSNSFSEPCENGDILHCIAQNGIIVKESEYCDKWN